MTTRRSDLWRVVNRGGYWQAGVMLIAATGLLLMLGSGCSCDDDSDTSNYSKLTSVNPPSRDLQLGGTNGPIQPGQQVARNLVVNSTAAGDRVDIDYVPPPGATNVRFTGLQPANPAEGPPFHFLNVPPTAAGDNTPVIQVSYSAPPPPDPSSSKTQWLVDEFKVNKAGDNNGEPQVVEKADLYATQKSVAESQEVEMSEPEPLVPEQPALHQTESVAATYQAWMSELWFYADDKQTLDETTCNAGLNLIASNKVFFATSFAPRAGSSGTSYVAPSRFRLSSFELLEYSSGPPTTRMSFPFKPVTGRASYLHNNLPTAAGRGWVAAAADVPTGTTCPKGLQLGGGKWEVKATSVHDFGGGSTDGQGTVLEFFVCYEGQSSPVTTAVASLFGIDAESKTQSLGITCVGPSPVFLNGIVNPSPPFNVSGPGFASVTPPKQVKRHHYIGSSGSSTYNLSLTTTSSRGLPWILYNGDFQSPNMGSPITGPISFKQYKDFWAVVDIPAGTSDGPETLTITATNTAQPTQKSWNVDHVWIGAWVPPPTPTPTPQSEYRYWVPVASHGSGLNQSQWRTDLGLLYPNTGTTILALAGDATVKLRLYAGGTVQTLDVTVPKGDQVILVDVVGQMNFIGGGALEVVSTEALKVSSRTYALVDAAQTCYPKGTFGQNYDAVPAGSGLVAGESAFLPGLIETSTYRSNIAVTNIGSIPATVTVRLYDETATLVRTYSVALNPGERKQDTQSFLKAGKANMPRGYAKITVDTGAGVLADASVVNNKTSDPATVNMMRAGSGATHWWIPVASHAGGNFQSQWRTDLGMLSQSTSDTSVELKLYTPGSVKTQTAQVIANTQWLMEDVVNLFTFTGSAALEIVSAQPILPSSRTYNLVASNVTCYPGGTLGQNYEASKAGEGLSAGQSAYLPQLVETTSDYRTNIMLTNTGTTQATVTVRLYNGTGTELTSYQVVLDPGARKQDTQPFLSKAGQTNMVRGYAKVTVDTGSGVIASASVTDNKTNDPTTIPMMR